MFGGRQDLSVGPWGSRKVRVTSRRFSGFGLNPDLHLRESGEANLCVASHWDGLAFLGRSRDGKRCRESLEPAIHIIVTLRVSVVCVIEVGEHDVGQPFDGLEA